MNGQATEPRAFLSVAQRLRGEREARRKIAGSTIPYGVSILDDYTRGITPHDFVILGGYSGLGKTTLATIIAENVSAAGRRVHYYALEAEPYEIERRLKYRIVVDLAYGARVGGLDRLNYVDWYLGKLDDVLKPLEAEAEAEIAERFGTLHTFYRGHDFGQQDLEQTLRAIRSETDLAILDHLHYVDSPDPNDNRGFREIAKTIRDTSLEIGKPALVVVHLRKRDRLRPKPIPELDDIHGTSDIAKICTRAIVIAKAPRTETTLDSIGPTYMRVIKDRMSGEQRTVARINFDRCQGRYEKTYQLGYLDSEKFEPLEAEDYPRWSSMSQAVPGGAA